MTQPDPTPEKPNDSIRENVPGDALLDEPKDTPEETPEDTPENPDQPNPEDAPQETPENPDPTPDPVESHPKFQEMMQTVADLQEQLKIRAEEQPGKKEQEPPRERTPQEWAEVERGWGFSRGKNEDGTEFINVDPRKMIERMNVMANQLLDITRKERDEAVHGSTSEIRFNTVVDDMAKKTPDLKQYSDAIRDYLKKRYQPKDFSNPDFIMDGYFWAKGKGMKNVVKRVEQGQERNRKIIKPASPANNGKAPGDAPLTAQERKLIADGVYKDEAELRRWKKADLSRI